ncbi:hypothetical protein N0V94_008461 [Neodidymelliopsis sp. IMI 364377]|nr:hypothetical protein N0V94_008461 [Neodidymelliopsis sp. IMI 364377]
MQQCFSSTYQAPLTVFKSLIRNAAVLFIYIPAKEHRNFIPTLEDLLEEIIAGRAAAAKLRTELEALIRSCAGVSDTVNKTNTPQVQKTTPLSDRQSSEDKSQNAIPTLEDLPTATEGMRDVFYAGEEKKMVGNGTALRFPRAEEPIDPVPSIHDGHQAIEELRNILALAEGKFPIPAGDFILFFPSFFKAQDWLTTTKNPQHAWMQAVFAALLHSNIGHKGNINVRVEEDLAAASRSFVADYVQEEHVLTFEAFTEWLWPAITAALRKVRTDRLGRKTSGRGPPPSKKQRFQ